MQRSTDTLSDSKQVTSSRAQDTSHCRQAKKRLRVKSVLHTSYAPPGARPLSREEQVQGLSDHLRACLLAGEGGSLYVSGLPGTGKTLTVHAVVRACCQDMAGATEGAPVPLSINCMTLAAPQAVFARLLDGVQAAAQLPLKPQSDGADPFIQPGAGSSAGGDSVMRELRAALGATQQDALADADRRQSMGGRRSSIVGGKRSKRMIVAVLDEMDQLISQDQSVLYELFTLATLKGCRLVLVGIANSIDLTARVLPRLQLLARRPQLITFPSYSAAQLEALLHQRLASLPGPVFHPQAIRLVAKKTASRSGDMRQVLDACAAAIDIVVQQATETAAAAEPGDDMTESTEAPLEQKPLVRVGIHPMFKSISQLQGGGSTAVLAVKGLPPQQQLLLCAAANLIGDASANSVQTPLKGTPSRRLSGLGCSTPMSASNKRRLSFGFSDGVGTPGRINMSRRLSIASDASTGSGSLQRKHDCILGELHSAYEDLCKKVAFKALAPSEVSAACSTLADMGLLGLGHAREERQRRVTLRMAVADIALALADARLIRGCLTYDDEINA
ncbi:P-loop containing nucleoside triphosphate hydrolase protein [Coccomyxa subellipsoidea C-169]|uniref:Cell division control protein n=1 Tax=Coccomyxa subellipsoidea (strain C-169) TaxID=574566 RepID=I0YJN0_COCSC|nr:P-loop containing nucleoside triphosphate hydrolase protein [Coccomyxa subellipsoidea C-169]EIE18599.1 P-loop containing nucleoside triphosphate hydrolase protein [Coccomyxa subellipsoidea C-169]|eukprot:XP_005643143.1 P-loop containing nucleoside triphosphate hydrolase protein [Coccomyxa subellipsoidea C-169]